MKAVSTQATIQPTLSSLAEDYYLELQMKNRTPETLKSYRWYLARFLKFLDTENIDYPNQLTAEILRAYHLELFLGKSKRGKLGAAWVNPYLVPVRSFLVFIKKSGWLPADPADMIAFVKAPKLLPKKILNGSEMVNLIEAPDISTILGYRDRTIMEVLYSTAVRRTELCDLKVQSLDLEECLLRVFGKGQRERISPLGRISVKFLEVYLSSVRPLLLKNRSEEHLFLSSRGKQISKNLVGTFIAKYAEMAGIEKRVTPHTFRHTCATLMLRNGADIRHIQELLGHESLNTTQIYTQVAVADLRKVLKKYHPREQSR